MKPKAAAAKSRTDPASVTEYIAAQPPPARAALRRVRSTMRRALPGADELLSYKIPAFKLDGRVVIYFAGWKEHYSIYPADARLVAAFRDELAPYEVNNKGTIRFPLSEPVPVRLIERIAAFRARAVAGRATRKAAAKKR